jgi:hypothetical protein
LKTSQFLTNGTILAVNVPNVNIYFFDMETGKKIGEIKSEHILMCYTTLTHKFYTFRAIGANQVLFEVAFDNFLQPQPKELQTGESFDQA